MTFSSAVKSAFSKYAMFEGRASRSEYWWFIVFMAVTAQGARFLDWVSGMTIYPPSVPITAFVSIGYVSIGWWLATLIPVLAVSVRRLHDTDHSGWWLAGVAFPMALGNAVFLYDFGQITETAASTPVFRWAVVGWVIYCLAFLVWLCRRGSHGDNRFGPDPLEEVEEECRAPSSLPGVLGTVVVVGLLAAVGLGVWLARTTITNSTDDQVQESSSIWTISDERDSMTDAVIHTATAEFSQSPYAVEAWIRCSEIGGLSYTFNTFNEDAQPAPMKRDMDLSVLKAPFVLYQIRLNDDPVKNALAISDRYNNQIVIDNSPSASFLSGLTNLSIQSSIGAGVFDSGWIANARRIRLKIPMASGDLSLDIDQTDPNLSQVISRCKKPEKAPVDQMQLDSESTATSSNEPIEQANEEEAEARFAELGQCEDTRIASISSRLDGIPDSGSAVSYENGIYGVSYDIIPEVEQSSVGDPVRLCLIELPENCPVGDDRGRVYQADNLRTGQRWSLANASHECGGA